MYRVLELGLSKVFKVRCSTRVERRESLQVSTFFEPLYEPLSPAKFLLTLLCEDIFCSYPFLFSYVLSYFLSPSEKFSPKRYFLMLRAGQNLNQKSCTGFRELINAWCFWSGKNCFSNLPIV